MFRDYSMNARCWLITGLVAAVTGCGTGAYNEAYQARIAEITSGAGGASLFEQATEVKTGAGTTSGTIRLPTWFASPTALQAADEGGQPPFLALPGFAYAFQQEVDVGGTKAPVFVYFAGVDAASNPVDTLKQTLKDELAKGGFTAEWEAVALAAPGGGATLNANRLRVVGPQNFAGAQADGQFDLYLVSTPTNQVLIGWRAPKAAADSIGLPGGAESSMATFIAAN